MPICIYKISYFVNVQIKEFGHIRLKFRRLAYAVVQLKSIYHLIILMKTRAMKTVILTVYIFIIMKHP